VTIDLDALIARTSPRSAPSRPRLDLDALIAKTAVPAKARAQAAPAPRAPLPAPPKREDITEDMVVEALDVLTAKLGPATGYRSNFVDPLLVRYWLDFDGERVVIAEETPYTKHDANITPRIRAALLRYAAKETEIRLKAARQQKLPIPGLSERLAQVGPLSVEAQATRRGTGKVHSEGGTRGAFAIYGGTIEIGGRHYVNTGNVSYMPSKPEATEMQEVVPAATWKHPTLTEAQMYRTWDLGLGRRGASYRGVKILVKGEPWVMTGKVLPVMPRTLSWDLFTNEVARDTKTGRYWFLVAQKTAARGKRSDPSCVWAVDAEAKDPRTAPVTCVDTTQLVREWLATPASISYRARRQDEEKHFSAYPAAVKRFQDRAFVEAVHQAALARIPERERVKYASY
jgi:hypothetical protein